MNASKTSTDLLDGGGGGLMASVVVVGGAGGGWLVHGAGCLFEGRKDWGLKKAQCQGMGRKSTARGSG